MKMTTSRWLAAAAATVAALSVLTAPMATASAHAPVETAGFADGAKASPSTASSPRTKKTSTTKKAPTTRTLDAQPAVTTAAAQAAIAADYTSIFADQSPALTDAGWATCPAAITWTVDTSALPVDRAEAQVANLQAAFDEWSQATGLVFQYAGTASFAYDDGAFNVTAADGSAQPQRSIYLDFVTDAASARLGGGVVGLASPSAVWQASKEIVNGEAVFLSDYIATASDAEAQALYVHELGHILGLGHASESANRMYAIVSNETVLGAGDVNGAVSVLKPCTTAA